MQDNEFSLVTRPLVTVPSVVLVQCLDYIVDRLKLQWEVTVSEHAGTKGCSDN